mgnify:CR=1 FL=1
MDATTKQLVKPLEDLYAKAPALPTGAKDFIVSITPWLALIFGVLLVLSSVGALAPFSTYAGVGGSAMWLMVYSVLGIAEGALMILAFSGLKNKKLVGWNWLFWAEIIGLVSPIVSLRFGGLLGAIVGAVIGFYFLFQIKSYYK